MKIITAYLITNRISGRRYTGITSQTSAARWREHVYSAKRPTTPFARAIKKYGAAAFVVEDVASTRGWEAGFLLEGALIAQFGTLRPRGYNLIEVGGPGGNHSQENRDRISRSVKRRHADPAYAERRKAALKVAMNRPEVREKMAAILRNRPPPSADALARLAAGARRAWADPEYRARASAKRRGRKMPAGQGQKISAINKGRKRSPEQRARMSAGRKGMKFTEEHRRNIGKAAAGRITSDETKAKLVISMRRSMRSKHAKLTAEDVAEIKYLQSADYGTPICDIYAVSRGLISKIKHGQAWVEVQARDPARCATPGDSVEYRLPRALQGTFPA